MVVLNIIVKHRKMLFVYYAQFSWFGSTSKPRMNIYRFFFITDRQMYRESWPFNFSIGQTYWSSCFLGQKFKKNFANIFLWGQWINTFVYLYGDNFSVSKSLGVWGENGRLSIRPKWPFYPRGAFYFRAKFSRSLFTGGINFLWRLIRLHP